MFCLMEFIFRSTNAFLKGNFLSKRMLSSHLLLTKMHRASEFKSNQPSFYKVSISIDFAYFYPCQPNLLNSIQRKTANKIISSVNYTLKKLLFLKSRRSHNVFTLKGRSQIVPCLPCDQTGKSSTNFNSKFSANLDFKEFELRPLNLQQIYVPCQIKGALAFQTNISKKALFF